MACSCRLVLVFHQPTSTAGSSSAPARVGTTEMVFTSSAPTIPSMVVRSELLSSSYWRRPSTGVMGKGGSWLGLAPLAFSRTVRVSATPTCAFSGADDQVWVRLTPSAGRNQPTAPAGRGLTSTTTGRERAVTSSPWDGKSAWRPRRPGKAEVGLLFPGTVASTVTGSISTVPLFCGCSR